MSAHPCVSPGAEAAQYGFVMSSATSSPTVMLSMRLIPRFQNLNLFVKRGISRNALLETHMFFVKWFFDLQIEPLLMRCYVVSSKTHWIGYPCWYTSHSPPWSFILKINQIQNAVFVSDFLLAWPALCKLTRLCSLVGPKSSWCISLVDQSGQTLQGHLEARLQWFWLDHSHWRGWQRFTEVPGVIVVHLWLDCSGWISKPGVNRA